MALTGWGVGNYLSRAPAPVSAYPFYLSIWCYRDFTTGNRFAISVGEAGLDSRRGAMRSIAGTEWTVISTLPYVEGGTTATQPLNGWFHGSGAFVADALREARLLGGNRFDVTGTSAPAAATSMRIGRDNAADGGEWGAAGALAEASIWDLTSFTQANRDALDVKLAAGENPLNITAESGQIWTGKLIAYWPLTDTGTMLTDLGPSGLTLSLVGTLSTFASHPTIDPPGPPPPPPQFARPSTDTTRINWEDESGGTTTLYSHIDEAAPANDADFIRTGLSPSNAIYVTKATVVTDPLTSGASQNHTYRFRYGKDLAIGQQIDLTIQLRQGYANEGSPGTLIHSEVLTNVSVFPTAGSLTLTESETNTITDYNNLFWRLVGNAP